MSHIVHIIGRKYAKRVLTKDIIFFCNIHNFDTNIYVSTLNQIIMFTMYPNYFKEYHSLYNNITDILVFIDIRHKLLLQLLQLKKMQIP